MAKLSASVVFKWEDYAFAGIGAEMQTLQLRFPDNNIIIKYIYIAYR